MERNVFLIPLLVLVLLSVAAPPAHAARATPPVAAACDLIDWRVAQLGRANLPAPIGMADDGLLVITGGAFAGGDAAQVKALIEAAGVDVVNLAHRDLVGEAAAFSGATLVSASFTLPQGAPWKNQVVVERGGKRVAVIGVAQRSAFAAGTIDGLQYVEPRAAIKKAIADAGKVDSVVVLADAPLSEATAWLGEMPEIDALVVSGRGGGRADVPSLSRILRAPPGGAALGALPADAAKAAFAVNLDEPAEPSDEYRQLASRFPIEPALPKLDDIAPVAAPLKTPPQALEVNRLTPLGLTASNRAAVVTVRSAGVFDGFAGTAAPSGRRYLVLDLHFRNILTPAIVRDQQVPVAYQMQKLSDHLYLVADEKRVLTPVPFDGGAGMLSTDELTLPRAGTTAGGKLVYEIDAADPPRALTLRLYDYAHGHARLPVIAPAGGPATAEQPLAPPRKNEVVEIAPFKLEKSDDIGGQKAPAGMVFVSVDVRARSLFTFAADATAFNPKARPGSKTEVGTVADWTESWKYLQLVVDREYGYVPQPQLTSLLESPRFLPDVMTGGRVVFLAPKEHKLLELRCDWPNAKTPGGKVIRPRGVTLPLEGTAPPAANIRPIAQIDDDFFRVIVAGQSVTDTFAGRAAASGKRFVVVHVTVNNRSNTGEMFQTAQQLKLANAAGQQLEIDPATYDGVHRPARLLWIPPGERRSFAVAYQIPASETRPRLAYGGVSKAEVIELARLAPVGETGPDAGRVTVTPPQAQPAAPPAPSSRTSVAPAGKSAPEFIEVSGRRFPARVPVRPDLKPRGLAGVGLTPEQVNAAIDSGMVFLWNLIRREDLEERKQSFGSDREHVLAALALVHSGAHRRFPEFDAHLRKFLASHRPQEVSNTYEIGLFCMLVEAYGDPTFLPQLEQSARWLIENQGPEGSWGYGIRPDPKIFADAAEKKVLRVAGGRPMDGSDIAQPLERLTPWEKGGDGDNSVTQYAMLGLHSASRSRIKSSAELWRRALEAHVRRQSPDDGGWAYHGGGGSYGSMTCAGLCALALSRHELGGATDADLVERLERGLAWMSAHFSVANHPKGSDSWLYYYLYSVERVGRILDTEFIGDHEWYPLGARAIIDSQQPDGAWKGKGEEDDQRIAGSFALLYLTRATPSLAEPRLSGPGVLKTAVSLPPGRKVYIILDASGSMLEEMDGKPKFEIARDAVASLVKELPPNAELALRAYGYRRRAIEEGASEDSKLLVPMAPVNKEKLLQLISGIRARGKTPLAYSLEEARKELPPATAESPLTVLLLTDGGEDTQPRRDPVAAARAYAELPNVRFRIVGFDINRQDWSEQLQAMAAASKGLYLPAAKGDALIRELRTAVFETPESFAVLDEGQKQVAAGRFGESVQLPAGKYRIRALYAGRAFEETAWVNAGTTTAVTFEAANAAAAPPAGTPGAPAPPAVAVPRTPSLAPTARPQARFCTSCGAALKPDAQFCTQCGAKTGS